MVDNIMSKLLIENAPSGSLKASEDGAYPVVLITPGQGSSGYYHEEVIRDYAPVAFPKGTHVYLDHLKEGETRSPERLLGTLIEDTVVNESGEAVNRFKPLSKHADWVEEVRPYVGLSVAVRGDGRRGEIDGRQTLIVESLEPHVTNTVDMVSFAGRGGRFLESYLEEALASDEDTNRTPASLAESTEGNETTMALEEKVDALTSLVEGLVAKFDARESAEAEAQAQADAASADRQAIVEAVRAVETADISDSTKARLVEGITKGNLDVADAIEQEKVLREEIRNEYANLIESAGASASNGGAATDDLNVQGW